MTKQELDAANAAHEREQAEAQANQKAASDARQRDVDDNKTAPFQYPDEATRRREHDTEVNAGKYPAGTDAHGHGPFGETPAEHDADYAATQHPAVAPVGPDDAAKKAAAAAKQKDVAASQEKLRVAQENLKRATAEADQAAVEVGPHAETVKHLQAVAGPDKVAELKRFNFNWSTLAAVVQALVAALNAGASPAQVEAEVRKAIPADHVEKLDGINFAWRPFCSSLVTFLSPCYSAPAPASVPARV